MCLPGVDLWRLSGSPDYISIPRIYVWRIEYPRRSSGLHHSPTSDITRGSYWPFIASRAEVRCCRFSLVVTLGVSSDLQSLMFIGIRLKKNCGIKNWSHLPWTCLCRTAYGLYRAPGFAFYLLFHTLVPHGS
ncbi:hypothetical protein QTP88_029481 [Uroleucon formosanum]